MKVYHVWKNMIDRCSNPRLKFYPYYGGRGIKVCERWQDIKNFFLDMGEPRDGKTLDRINPDGDYCPENCRWATRREQVLNRRIQSGTKADGTVIGVYASAPSGWMACLKRNGKVFFRKRFKTRSAAITARREAEVSVGRNPA
jgi:hypothetical protein